MSDYTKGPWAVGARKGDDWDSVVYVPNTPNEICQCFHDLSNVEECTANARLISAAPELLEALQTALEALSDLPLMDPRIVEIRAAIAKALGE